MRIYQTIFTYPSFVKKNQALAEEREIHTFSDVINLLRSSGYCYPHVLDPEDADKLFIYSPELSLASKFWKRQHGMPESASEEDVILSQIEEWKADVVYFQNPGRFNARFLKKLPSAVRYKLCWSSSHISAGKLEGYDCVLTSFEDYAAYLRERGVNTKIAYPSVASPKSYNELISEREKHLVFAGGWSRQHCKRNKTLEILSRKYEEKFSLFLDTSIKYRWAEKLNFSYNPFFVPPICRKFNLNAKFGFEMIEEFSRHSIVFNEAIDNAPTDRGNIRCFEALTAGSLLVSDRGKYPPHFEDGINYIGYSDVNELSQLIDKIIHNPQAYENIAKNGHSMVQKKYSKKRQYRNFMRVL